MNAPVDIYPFNFFFFMCVCGWRRVDSLEQDDNRVLNWVTFPYFFEAWFAETPNDNQGILSKHLNVQGEGSILMTDQSSVLSWFCQATLSCTWWSLCLQQPPPAFPAEHHYSSFNIKPSPAPVTPSLSLLVAECSHICVLSMPLHFHQSSWQMAGGIWYDWICAYL